MAVPLIAFAGVSMNISPITRGIYIVTVTLSTHTGPSVAADFAIWRCASPLAFPWADVTLEFTFVSMPTSSTVTVSTVTLAMASTHLSGVLVQTLAVVTLTEPSCHQTPVVLIVTQAAPAVAGTSVGAHDPLRVFAELFAFLVRQVTLILDLADGSGPAFVTLTRPTVTVAAVVASFPIMRGTDPVVTLAAWTVELPRICGLAVADAAVTLSPPTADLAIRGPAAAKGRLRGQLTHTAHLAHRL